MTGFLRLVLGPMFAGKTTDLINTYYNLKFTESVIAINYYLDKRYDDVMLTSHDGNKIPCLMIDSLFDAWYNPRNQYFDILNKSDYILINEGQFFDNLFYIVRDMLYNNKKVFIYALDGDFQQKKFGEVLDLVPLCDEIKKLNAKCFQCGGMAIFTHRITDEMNQVDIGVDNYIPLCRKCFPNNDIDSEIDKIADVD